MKFNRTVVLLALTSGVIVASILVEPTPAEAALKKYQIGLRISPIEIDTEEMTKKKKKSIGMGSYIVNAQSACADCHSCPTYAMGSNPFEGGDGSLNKANYLAGGAPFGGIRSRNLTPDPSGKPAGLTQGQFLTVISTGVNPVRGEPLRAVMPWAFHRFMTTKDLKGIYAYLKELPSAEPGVCIVPGQ